MSGHHSFRELTKDFSPERQARIADKVRLFQHALALAALRQARQQASGQQANHGAALPPVRCSASSAAATSRCQGTCRRTDRGRNPGKDRPDDDTDRA